MLSRERSLALASTPESGSQAPPKAGITDHDQDVRFVPKPSCLISWSQSGLGGGVLAGDGRRGSMKPTVRRTRSNMMLG
jgi:hypothetical protein